MTSLFLVALAVLGGCTTQHKPASSGAASGTQPFSGTVRGTMNALSDEVSSTSLTLSPGTIDFGSIPKNSSTVAIASLINRGTSDITHVTVSVTAEPMHLDDNGCASGTIPAGTSCTLTFRFKPTAAGAFVQQLTVASDGNSDLTLTLFGVANDDAPPSPPPPPPTPPTPMPTPTTVAGPTWGNGIVFAAFKTGYASEATKLAVQPADQKVLVAGKTKGCTTTYPGIYCPALFRFNTDGSLDSSFGQDGKVIFPQTPAWAESEARQVVLQSDGKILLAVKGTNPTTRRYAFSAYRLNPDGTLDTTFATGGKAYFHFHNSYHDFTSSIALAPDGKIVLAGTVVGPWDGRNFAVVRLLPSGCPDTTFGPDHSGGSEFFIRGPDDENDVSVDANGNIYLAGARQYDMIVARVNPMGDLDPSFGIDGIARTDVAGRNDAATSVKLLPNGNAISGGFGLSSHGQTGYDFVLAQFNHAGALVSAFGNLGLAVTAVSKREDRVNDIALTSDGRIVAGGFTTRVGTRRDLAIAMYRADGSLDTTFGGGVVTISPSVWADVVKGVAVQANGYVLASGSCFNRVTQLTSACITRLKPDGCLDK